MIRKYRQADLDQIMTLWLDTNIRAHPFITKDHWLSNYQAVKSSIPQAQVYVYEDRNGVQGFIGLKDGYIAGIFVSEALQSQGIGKSLLDKCKSDHARLDL